MLYYTIPIWLLYYPIQFVHLFSYTLHNVNFMVRKMPKKSSTFSEDNIASAIQAVHDGMSKKKAASKFGVARSTIQFRMKNPDKTFKCGSAPILTEAEESLLVKWIIESCRKGFPRRREDVQYSVKKYLDNNKRTTPFKENLPGKYFY